MMRKFAWLLAVLVSLPLCIAGTIRGDYSFYQPVAEGKRLAMEVAGPVRNVILLIGDGMGLAQVASAQFTAVGPDHLLYLQTMPVTGLMNTHSQDRLITDSAASGTAFATGHKTNNGMIAMLPDGTEVKTILEAAEQEGLSTGLVVTCELPNATPAAFTSHNQTRNDETGIALEMSREGVDVLFGAGWRYFLPPPQGMREDGRDLIREMEQTGYSVARTVEQFKTVTAMPVIGMFADVALQENVPEEPSLAEMTAKALDLLSQDQDGFFIMIEGSQIDWEGHANEEDELVRRLLNFDMAVGRALEFAEQDGHTLVVVTADHETGGESLVLGNRDGSGIVAQFTSTSHTPVPVGVFAYGPGALAFTGVYENSDLAWKLASALGLKEVLESAGREQAGK